MVIMRDEQEARVVKDSEDRIKSNEESRHSALLEQVSRKDYTLHQHIMLIVLAQYAGSIERMLHGLMFFGE